MARTRALSTWLAIAALVAAGCSDSASENPDGWRVDGPQEHQQSSDDESSQMAPARIEASQQVTAGPTLDERFVVHEWGTFTSVQTPDGFNLEGLHHEEEALPPFVYDMAQSNTRFMALQKGILGLPGPVTQKLETPVIYFYGGPDSARVDVTFPEGLITEWYPQNTTYGPAGYPSDIRDGIMSWDVELSDDAEIVEVPEDDIWQPSREVPDARYVTSGDESDKFIFYRGLGRFELPFETRLNDSGEYTLANESAQRIPQTFVLEVKEQTGHIYEVGAIDGFSERSFEPAPKEMPQPIDVMVEDAKTKVAAALVDTGLTRAEADAMVNTWERSYFTKPGHRVLYVVPRTWTDELLPIEVTPQPDELVRTLVGRIDIVTPAEEQAMVERIERTYTTGDMSGFYDDPDRFLEPRVRAACRQIDARNGDPAVYGWCRTVAQNLTNHMPSRADEQQ